MPEDIKELAVPVLRKRIILSADQAMRGVGEVQIIEDVLDRVEVPVFKSEE